MIEIIIYGTLISSLYALLATGFTMIYGVGGILNLTHGILIIFAGYVILLGSTVFNLFDVYTSTSLAIILTTLFSLGIYKVLVRPFIESEITIMIVTLVFSLTIEQLIKYFNPHTMLVPPIIEGTITILENTILAQRVLGLVVSLLLMLGIWLLVNKTKIGKAILAASMDRDGSLLVGIDIEKIQITVWCISGFLAGVGGIFLGSFVGVNPTGWRMPLIFSFSIVVLGGLGNIPGAVASAYIIGFLETIIAFLWTPKLRGVPSLVIIILVLLFRPEGLFGRADK